MLPRWVFVCVSCAQEWEKNDQANKFQATANGQTEHQITTSNASKNDASFSKVLYKINDFEQMEVDWPPLKVFHEPAVLSVEKGAGGVAMVYSAENVFIVFQ